MPRELRLFEDFDRREVHDIFDPDSPFTPQSGSWGLWGILKIPEREQDYVFFVTIGQQQSGHVFQEGIDTNGILTWQSQPKQRLVDKQIKDFIAHDYLMNNIYLFLRTQARIPYTYLGRLAYVVHDPDKQQPVWFKWQLVDWPIPADTIQRMGLRIQTAKPDLPTAGDPLIQTPPPATTSTSHIPSHSFQARITDYATNDTRSRAVGEEGELLVLEQEKADLCACGRGDLAEHVRHVSKLEGDGAGYDIQSYKHDGTAKYIEVKTTTGGPNTPFFVTLNELAFSQEHAENYYLYRLYLLDRQTHRAKYYVVNGILSGSFTLEPIAFRAKR